MQKDIKTLLNEMGIDENELEKLLQQDKKIEAIKLIHQSQRLGLKESKELVDHISENKTNFTFTDSKSQQFASAKMVTNNDGITVTLTENGHDKIVTPADPDWERVKRMLGNTIDLQDYEDDFVHHPMQHQKKSNLFIEEKPFQKWKYFVLIIAALILAYLIYAQKF